MAFTLDDIYKLKNPTYRGQSLLLSTIEYHALDIDNFDLQLLKKIPNVEKTIYHRLIEEYGIKMSFNEIVAIRNPSDENGNTVAHIMSKCHCHKFSDKEIYFLGNPRNKKGELLSKMV